MADLTDSRVLHALAQFSEEPVPEWKKRFDLQFMWLLQRVCDHHFIHIVWSAVGIPLELGVEWYGPLTNLLLPVLYVNPEWPSLCPHNPTRTTCCCRLLRFRCTSQRGGIPGTDHAMDTPTNCDHAWESETKEESMSE